MIVALIAAACGGASAPVQTAGRSTPAPTQPAEAPDETEDVDYDPAGADATPGTALTACELVTPADIETAVGLDAGTVSDGELTVKGTTLDPAANQCRYDGDEWGGLIVNVTPTDGLNTYDAVHDVFGDDAEKISGIGDGAMWFPERDRGYFIKGSVMIMLQYTYLTEGDFDTYRDPTVSVGTAAVNRI